MYKNQNSQADQNVVEFPNDELLEKSLSYDKASWIECLTECEKAIEAESWSPAWSEVLKNLFSKGRDNYFLNSIELDAEYKSYFQRAANLLEKIAKEEKDLNYELACLYREGRRGFQDIKKYEDFLEIAADNQLGEAISLKAWGLYFGIYSEKDPSAAYQTLESIEDKKDSSYLFVSGYFKLIEGNEEEFETRIKEVIKIKDTSKGFYASSLERFGDYLISKDRVEQGIACIKEGAELNGAYALYSLGWRTMQGYGVEKNETLAIEYLRKGYLFGAPHAADYLGNYYFGNKDLALAEEWYKKGVQVNHHESFLNLARVYLYHKENNTTEFEMAVALLKEAAGAKHSPSLTELAYIYKNGIAVEQNYEAHINYLKQAVELGDSYAMYLLGLEYETQEQPDYEKAFELFKQSAHLGHIYGMEYYAHYCRLGIGCEPNAEEAVEFYNRAIARGSAYARVELALCYERGFGVEQSDEQAFNQISAAAEQEYPYAINKLAEYYENGVHVQPDDLSAFECYKKAATYEHPMYWYNLGRCYRYAIGTEENETEAVIWLSKAVEAGYGEAEVEMALCYESGYGVEKDPQKAFDYMLKAANKNFYFAQYKLGTYYLYEFPEYDLEKSVEWFTRASDADYSYADLYLGDIFLYHMENSDEKAFHYYKKAAEKDYYSEGLGVCYYYGYGTESNETEAFKAFLKGAQANYTKAKFYLALCYKNGDGVNANLQEAIRWMTEASDAEYAPAQFELAMMYSKGEGVVADVQKSVSLLRLAADNENNHAQYELGNCYLVGKGVEEDEQLAVEWFERAADNGNEKARKILGRKN